MRKVCASFLLLLLLCVNTQHIFSYDGESPGPDESKQKKINEAIVSGLIASGEALLVNGIIMSSNILYFQSTGKQPWAIPSKKSIWYNLSTPWEWEDTDDFIVNQLGHPTQGALYYSAGRVNGFGYYESAFFSALGSFTFEAFGESNQASLNDFITTVTSSLSAGEIFYRLYMEACAAGVPWPIALLINPTAGAHRFLTGWEPPNYGRNLNKLKVHLGMGHAETHYSLSSQDDEFFSFRGFFPDMGVGIIYGNPFEHESKVPFSHFELDMSLSMNIGNYMNIRLISDGYLFSFLPVYTSKNMMSTGLSLHFDFVSLGRYDPGTSTINQYSNALDWTIKYQHLFSEDLAFTMKTHAGLTFMGSSSYYSPEADDEFKNYGAGFNAKLLFCLDHKKLGLLEMSTFVYAQWTFPFQAVTHFSRGATYWLFTDITYSYYFSKHFSAGITDSFVFERGLFNGGFPDTKKRNNAVKLFIAWNL